MTIATDAMRKVLANAWAAEAPYGALFTADPGTTGSATGEVTGGSPAYARKAMTYGAATTVGSTAVVTSAATAFDVPSGAALAYFGATKSATAGTADVRDKVAVTGQSFSSQGTYTVTSSYTQP